MLVLRGDKNRVELVRFASDGRSLFAVTYHGVQVWPIPGGGSPAVVGKLKYVNQLAVTPDGARLVTGGFPVAVTDLQSGETRTAHRWGSLQGCGFDLSPDGSHLVVTQNDPSLNPPAWAALLPVNRPDLAARVWEQRLTRGTLLNPRFIRDGTGFVLTEPRWDDTRFRTEHWHVVRSAATGEVVSEVEGPELNTWVTSPDGRWLAAIRHAKLFVLSPDDFSKPAAELRNDSRKEFTDAAFHPSGKFLATASNDKTIKFWDTASWGVATTFTWNAGRMRSIAFSPDGSLAAAGTDNGKIVVWDVDV